MTEITEVKCGKLTAVNLITRRYVLDTNCGIQYTLAGNDEKLSLYDDDGELGQILMEQSKTDSSGSIWMGKDEEIEPNDLIGIYQNVDGKYLILPYENSIAKDSWREDLHPLDYLIERIFQSGKK